MLCDNCGHDRYDTIKVFREKKLSGDKWVQSPTTDTRIIVCRECGARYYTTTKFTHKIEFDSQSLKKKVTVIEGTKEPHPTSPRGGDFRKVLPAGEDLGGVPQSAKGSSPLFCGGNV